VKQCLNKASQSINSVNSGPLKPRDTHQHAVEDVIGAHQVLEGDQNQLQEHARHCFGLDVCAAVSSLNGHDYIWQYVLSGKHDMDSKS
jgi:hypothetical protein